MLAWLSKDKNRALLSWIGGGVAVIAAGAWTVATYVWPHDGSEKSVVCAQGGSVASGRDSSGNIVINSSASGAPASSALCADAGKK